jgi:PAS domain S-box-containing protein
LFGYDRSELVGQRIEILVPERLRGGHEGHRAGYVAAPKTRAMGSNLDLFARHKDGHEFPVEISLGPLTTDGGVLVSSSIRDVTPRRRVEAELRRAKDVAEASRAELEAFSYSVAHDLRTPLRGISGFARALVEDFGPELDAQAQEYLQRIEVGAMRMGQLIDALLSLARLSRAELVRERVDLTALAHGVVEHLRAADPGRVVDVAISAGLSASGDPHLLRSLLENLLGNAWKFTARASSPKIELGRETNAGVAAFVVRDNGVGFDVTNAEKIFAPFARLHAAGLFPGTGIGLATVNRIVRRHGGRIWAEAAVNEGASFYFTLDGVLGADS